MSKLLFEQTYMAARAMQDADGVHLEFSILNGPTMKFSFEDESDAKAAYSVLESKYLEALRSVQNALLQAHEDSTGAIRNEGT